MGQHSEQINAGIASHIGTFPALAQRATNLEHWIQHNHFREASNFAEEFYSAYVASSGQLTLCFGPERLLTCFRLIAPFHSLVSPDDEARLADMADPLVVYRGGRGPVENLQKGLSWTTYQETAEGYMDSPGDLVLRTTVPKETVLAYFTFCNECIVDPSTFDRPIEVVAAY